MLQEEFQQQGCKLDVKVEPMMKTLEFSTDQLDSKYNRDYTTGNYPKTDKRGGYDYHLPLGWKRYAISIGQKYENENWLKMDKEFDSGAWCVAYHGTAYTNAKEIIQKDYVVGKRQMYKDSIDVNSLSIHKGEQIGNGVYVSNIVEEAYQYSKAFKVDTSEGILRYRMVIQNRVKPDQVRFPGNKQTYWIINNPMYIRPYGILVKEEKN